MYLYELRKRDDLSLQERADIAAKMLRAGRYNHDTTRHHMVCDFADSSRSNGNLLYADLGDILLVQSDIALNPEIIHKYGYYIQSTQDVEQMLQKIEQGDEICIRTILNPTKAMPGKKNNRKCSLTDIQERQNWIIRKFHAAGLTPLQLGERKLPSVTLSHKDRNGKRHQGNIYPYAYKGIVRVDDTKKLMDAVHQGIGRGKSYGCGLILVERPQEKKDDLHYD